MPQLYLSLARPCSFLLSIPPVRIELSCVESTVCLHLDATPPPACASSPPPAARLPGQLLAISGEGSFWHTLDSRQQDEVRRLMLGPHGRGIRGVQV